MLTNLGQCFFCGETVYPDDERVSTGFGPAHFECSERHDLEMEASVQRDLKAEMKNRRLLARLKRCLPPKLWQPIQWEIDSNWYHSLEMVTKKDVKGEKVSGHDHFGQSTALRHVYENVSSDSYSDSYGGDVYLRLGKDRYLKMFIHG